MITLEKAIELAVLAHNYQLDKCGNAYITHPLRVAVKFNDNKHIITALLHDTLEDGNEGVRNKIKYSLRNDKEILEALELLTHEKNTPYFGYITNLSKNALARDIKMGDLTDNMDKSRFEKALSLMNNEEDKERFTRKQNTYSDAYTFLKEIKNSEIKKS